MENSFIKRWEERPMGRLGEKRLFLLDMDGTIYLDEALFPGTLPFLKAVRARGGRYLFLTNNSSKSVDAYIAKLGRMGIEAGREDFLTSVDALIADLAGRPPYRLCYAFGTRSFQSQLQAAGIPVTDRLEDGVDCLLIGFDTELTFQKLEDACILLNRGVDFIATNPDWVCPTWYGSVPDCGSVCEMLYRAAGRRPRVIGKPQPAMARLAMARHRLRGQCRGGHRLRPVRRGDAGGPRVQRDTAHLGVRRYFRPAPGVGGGKRLRGIPSERFAHTRFRPPAGEVGGIFPWEREW